jgi:hypothetical protein
MLTVSFLGNCQAQNFEPWVMQARDKISVLRLPPIWLIEPHQVPEIIETIKKSDFVFAQRLSEDFIHPELRTSALKDVFSSKIVSWPNIYFDGYFPGVGYRYTLDAGKVLGPLDEYHWDLIENAFLAGKSATECAKSLSDPDLFNNAPDPVFTSLTNLAEREALLDVNISDFIATNLHMQQLFYSMNHPTSLVMEEMLNRLFGYIGKRETLKSIGSNSYELNKIILPILPSIAKKHYMTYDANNPLIKGVDIEFTDKDYKILDSEKIYTIQSLTEAFYRCYETTHKVNQPAI